MNVYEIYCTRFSQIIEAESLALAVLKFHEENPDEEVIFAENVKYKEREVEMRSIVRGTNKTEKID